MVKLNNESDIRAKFTLIWWSLIQKYYMVTLSRRIGQLSLSYVRRITRDVWMTKI